MAKSKKKDSLESSYVLTQRTKSEKIVFTILFVLLALYAISLIYPFIWLVLNSFKDFIEYNLDINLAKPFDLPDMISFDNYIKAFSLIQAPAGGKDVSYIQMLFNSLWITILTGLISIFSVCCVAYVLSKFKFFGSSFLYAFGIAIMTLPIYGSSGSAFKLIHDLGLYNTILYPIIVPIGMFGSNFLIFYGFFKNVSNSYAESAYIDGATELRVFLNIMLPQAKPCFITLFIMAFIGGWNDYMTILLYMPSFPTIASGMYVVKNTLLRTGKAPIYYAGIVISVIPVMALFIGFSDTIMTNMSIGGLKG